MFTKELIKEQNLILYGIFSILDKLSGVIVRNSDISDNMMIETLEEIKVIINTVNKKLEIGL